MSGNFVRELLDSYRAGKISSEAAEEALTGSLGFASLDYGREARQGFPEAVYAAGKTKEETCVILKELASRSEKSVLATRVSEETAAFVQRELPEAIYDRRARMLYVERPGELDEAHPVLILTAGTSDIPVAEEARLTARLCGCSVVAHYDCGVAGIHRLFAHMGDIERASVIIVCAGMEGALASVVGGLAEAPVIAVPTSVGYGIAAGGETALRAMLSSCAAGIAVVNIDNGFGAGMLAAKILRQLRKGGEPG